MDRLAAVSGRERRGGPHSAIIGTLCVVSVAGCLEPGTDVETLPEASFEERVAVASEIVLSVGGEPGGPGHDLYGVTGAVRLPDGRMFVSDRAQRVLSWDSAGAFLGSFGGAGQGPGEFRSISWLMFLSPDTLAINDASQSRISLFSLEGVYLSSFRARNAAGIFGDGSVLVRLPQRAAPMAPGEVLQRLHFDLARADRDEQVLDSIANVLDTELLVIPARRIAINWDDLYRTSYAVGTDRVFVAPGDRSEVHVYHQDGGEPQVIAIPQEVVPFSRDDALAYLASTPLGAGAVPSDLSTFPEDRVRRAITDLVLAESGELWVRETAVGAPDELQPWSVVDVAEGRVVARVLVSRRFQPLQIGADFILGVAKDDLNVERVQIRRLLFDRSGP